MRSICRFRPFGLLSRTNSFWCTIYSVKNIMWGKVRQCWSLHCCSIYKRIFGWPLKNRQCDFWWGLTTAWIPNFTFIHMHAIYFRFIFKVQRAMATIWIGNGSEFNRISNRNDTWSGPMEMQLSIGQQSSWSSFDGRASRFAGNEPALVRIVSDNGQCTNAQCSTDISLATQLAWTGNLFECIIHTDTMMSLCLTQQNATIVKSPCTLMYWPRRFIIAVWQHEM